MDQMNKDNIEIFKEFILKIRKHLISCCAIFVLGYFYMIQEDFSQLAYQKKQEAILMHKSNSKMRKPISHPLKSESIQQKITGLQIHVESLLKQLPEKIEVPALIESLSQLASSSGLQLKTLRLLPEKQKGFYVALPIEIAVTGGYHQMGAFVSKITGLPRIITLHDFTVHQEKMDEINGDLIMNITAKIYRYYEWDGKKSDSDDEDSDSDIDENNKNDVSINNIQDNKKDEIILYKSSHLRSPFSTVSSQKGIENFENGLKRVGTIEIKNQQWAIVEDPHGTVKWMALS